MIILPIHFIWAFYFAVHYNLHAKGLALATSITYCINFILIWFISKFNDRIYEATVEFFTLETLKGYVEYLWVSIPSMLMLVV